MLKTVPSIVRAPFVPAMYRSGVRSLRTCWGAVLSILLCLRRVRFPASSCIRMGTWRIGFDTVGKRPTARLVSRRNDLEILERRLCGFDGAFDVAW